MLRFIEREYLNIPRDQIFQYISCYGLSLCWLVQYMFRMSISIHLMLRFIFTAKSCPARLSHFNTSHVTVYLRVRVPSIPVNVISIHLMLRFIKCKLFRTESGNFISIHLMLRFICADDVSLICRYYISIHLMLRFIVSHPL